MTNRKKQELLFRNVRRASRFLKGLSNENRLLILCNLVDSEKCVSELEDILGIRQPTLSQQLARLRAERLVTTRRDGKSIYYSLASDNARAVIGHLHELFCAPRVKVNAIATTRLRQLRGASAPPPAS